MTVHTIPVDHVEAARGGVLVVDGKRSAKTVHGADLRVSYSPIEFVKLTEPCEKCGGLGSSSSVHEALCGGTACSPCRGSGRPWLTINVEHICFHEGQRLLIKEVCDCGTDDGITDSFRAHVLNVVRIVDDGENMSGRYAVLIEPEES